MLYDNLSLNHRIVLITLGGYNLHTPHTMRVSKTKLTIWGMWTTGNSLIVTG